MKVVTLRMEGQYARLLNRLLQRFQLTPVSDSNSEQVGALVRLYWAELMVIGYHPGALNRRGTFELLASFESDPLLAAMPVAVAIAKGQGDSFDTELALAPADYAARVLPIEASDFDSPHLEAFLRGHHARFEQGLNAVRDADLPGATEDDLAIDFPWESPEV